ncbi:hypothetical protein M8J77_023035 [Diaphorina citri]|nr:hypothetical protein M8J77_023035 [Diaphorina citri]
MVATTACCSLDCSCSDILSPPTASTVTAATLSQGPGSSALLAGHWIVFYMAIFAYISAITSTEDRTFRIGLVSTTSSVFNLLGSAISGVIVRNFGYIGTFSVVLLIYVCCFLYALFCIPEVNRSNVIRARSSTQKGSGVVVFLREFFDSANVRNTFVFLFRGGSCKEDPKRRTKLILIMIIVVVLNGPYQGEFTVMYLYTRLAFRWNEYNYSTFYTAYYFTDFLGSMFSVSYFTKYLKLNDSLVGVISVVSTLFGAIIFAFANTSFIFCFGAVASLFSNASFIAMRAIISKLTSAEELGKVMSAFMLFEAIAPMIYNPIYNAVYTATLDFMPSTFLLMSLVLTSPALFIFLWIYYHDKKLKNSSKQDNPDPR